jgi:hypothetical protein
MRRKKLKEDHQDKCNAKGKEDSRTCSQCPYNIFLSFMFFQLFNTMSFIFSYTSHYSYGPMMVHCFDFI